MVSMPEKNLVYSFHVSKISGLETPMKNLFWPSNLSTVDLLIAFGKYVEPFHDTLWNNL